MCFNHPFNHIQMNHTQKKYDENARTNEEKKNILMIKATESRVSLEAKVISFRPHTCITIRRAIINHKNFYMHSAMVRIRTLFYINAYCIHII